MQIHRGQYQTIGGSWSTSRHSGQLVSGNEIEYFLIMSMSEILEELPRLGRLERARVWQRLEEIEMESVEETPEVLEAIDAGRCSIRMGQENSIEHARNLIAQWITKSS